MRPPFHLIRILFFSVLNFHGYAQTGPIQMGTRLSDADFDKLKTVYGNKKSIPVEFEKEILTALTFFPQLIDHRIDFQLRKGYAPLSSRPTYGGLFRSAKKRKYKVFISTGSGQMWDSIILKYAPFDPSVGVLGHELSHVLNFSRMSGLSLVGLGINHVSKSYMNRFEFLTDSLCIEQGMGEYLLSMGVYVRKKFGAADPEELLVKGEKGNYKERYMSPSTIRLYMEDSNKYVK